MKFIEGLAGVAQWPTSRKVLLLGFPGVLATCLAAITNVTAHHWIVDPVVDVQLLNRFIGTWILVQLFATLVAVPAAIAGREARWTAHLFVALQCPFTAGLLFLFGTMASPLVAIFPTIVILWTLYLGPRYGAFGLIQMVLWIVVAIAVDASGTARYAPVLLERGVDAQQSALWSVTVFLHMLVLGAFCLMLCYFSLRSQQLQSRRLRELHAALERSNRLIRRYVPAQLVEQISAGDHDETSRPQRRKLTIVFVDIVGFTALSELADPEVLAAVLDDYLTEMVAIADRYGGTINQIVGDGVMIFFGAPQATNHRDHALRAVGMAQQMQIRAAELRVQWLRKNLEWPLSVRIGINTGYASVGDFGPVGRKLYSGIGLQTTLAEHVQTHCAPGRVLMTESTWALLDNVLPCVCRGEIEFKGLQRPVQVYELAAEAATPRLHASAA